MINMTKDELYKQMRSELKDLVNFAGGYNHLAKMLDTHPMTVKGWLSRGRISKEYAVKVGDHPVLSEHFEAKDLRPDLA